MREVYIVVSEELAEHYEKVKAFRDGTIGKGSTADHKDKAVALGAVTSILKELSRVQQDVYNSEKIAMLQAAVIEALEEADPEIQKRVLNILEKRLCYN